MQKLKIIEVAETENKPACKDCGCAEIKHITVMMNFTPQELVACENCERILII